MCPKEYQYLLIWYLCLMRIKSLVYFYAAVERYVETEKQGIQNFWLQNKDIYGSVSHNEYLQ